MARKTAVSCLFVSAILLAFVGCSSGDNKDAVSPDVAEATSDIDAPPTGDSSAPKPEDGMAANDAGNPPPADGAKPPETGEGEMAANPDAPPPGDANAAPPADAAAAANPPADANTPPPTDAAAAPATPSETAAPPTDTASNETPPPAAEQQQGDLFGAGASGGAEAPKDESAPPPRKKSFALAHIKDAPFSKGGQNLNTVYLARDGDTLDSISQKLFAEDKTSVLKKANPSLKKGVKTGDKVYFNSPNRPDDKDKMMTVYEDQGLPPSSYTTKEGDTLKSLAQEWYGSEASYKEIYSINRNLASTKELPPGTELQYWPATVTIAAYGAKKEPEVAQAAPPPPPANMPPPPGNMPPPPGAGTVGNNPTLPPPPSQLPPPPAPDLNAAPPPPPPPVAMSKHKKNDTNPMDKDTIMYAVAAGVLLIGGGALIGIRRRSRRNGQGITQI